MRSKHQEKAENLKNIEKLKKRVKQKGGDALADEEFDRIMNSKGEQTKKKFKGPGVLETVRNK